MLTVHVDPSEREVLELEFNRERAAQRHRGAVGAALKRKRKEKT